MIGPEPWRVAYKRTDRGRERATTYPCALTGWSTMRCTTDAYDKAVTVNAMVWDHCHRHGLIRGPLCGYHNGRMRHFDAGRERYLYDADLIEYSWRCAGCAPPW